MIFATILSLVCYRELTVVLITVGQGEGYDEVSHVDDVEVHAVGRGSGLRLYLAAGDGSDLNVNLAEVLQEYDGKVVAIDGGLDGGAFRSTLDKTFFYFNNIIAIDGFCAVGVTQCRKKH